MTKHQKSMSMHQQMSTTGYNTSHIKNQASMNNPQINNNMMGQGVNQGLDQQYGSSNRNSEVGQNQGGSKSHVNR